MTLALIFCAQAPCADDSPAADFFVAPNGDDGWAGRLAQPNAARTNGPFATLRRARDAVRKLKRRTIKKDLVVQIRGGHYRLSETLIFSLDDSAAENGTITYAAAPGEQPIITSGVPICNWRKLNQDPVKVSANARGKLWTADVPTELGRIFSLYDGEKRLPRARGMGFSPASSPDKKSSSTSFYYSGGAIPNSRDLKEAELLIIPTADYEMNTLPFDSIDEVAHVVHVAAPATRPIGKVKFVPVSAWVENLLEVLDEPGEWVVNSKERKIYFWPPGDRPTENIVAPKLTELVRIEGVIRDDNPRDVPVRGIILKGLTFQHAERYQWHGETGWGLQHHWEMFDRSTAAVRFRGAENCAVEACRVSATSGTGIRLDLYCQNNRVVGNEIGDLGGVGILLAGYGPGTKDVNRQNEVSNNWIHHTGEIYWATPAIMVWQSGENRVANNLIHDAPYSGITVSTRAGWNRAHADADRTVRWSEIGNRNIDRWESREPFMHARKNRIERNDIHDVMQIMGDGDGIYISGTGRQNLIRENYIHDCDGDGMADGIRCDDDQNETLIEGNVIYHTRCIGQGICSKGVNHIVNNLIADLSPSRRSIRPERVVRGYIGLEVNPVTGSRIERNLVVAAHNMCPPMIQDRRYGLGENPRLRDCRADHNLYFCFDDPDWGRRHLRREQAFGVERNSLCTDPLFVDFAKGDLRLKPESPALRLGFEPPDTSKIGLLPAHPYYRR